MRKALILGMAGLLLAIGATSVPAVADVREGVDAWSRGEYKKAVDQWRPAAIAGDADAQFNLGQAYSLGRGVPVDIPMAESWFRKAALQGHAEAEAKYGLVLFDQKKRAEALPWLEKAAKRGEPRAQLVLGTMLFNGDSVAKDWPRAYALLVRSAAASTPGASEVQAQMDTLIPTDQRQQGLLLARQYEAEAQRPQLPPEISGRGTSTAMRATDLPPSQYDPNVSARPQIVALAPPPAAKPTKPRVPPRAAAVAETAPAPAAGHGGWHVQLGAFGDPGNARKLWGQVSGRFAGASVSYVKSGALTRVLVGPYPSRAAAAAACGAVRPCVPVNS
ncbi:MULTISPECIES: SPOR domain-containing protein [Sphingomonas]|jgi:cell division septation protein DedD|uniref:SPOR domain-containing protein n=1 Tax=Sphingomonas TaxID=13687 RepID=UPI001AEB4DA4